MQNESSSEQSSIKFEVSPEKFTSNPQIKWSRKINPETLNELKKYCSGVGYYIADFLSVTPNTAIQIDRLDQIARSDKIETFKQSAQLVYRVHLRFGDTVKIIFIKLSSNGKYGELAYDLGNIADVHYVHTKGYNYAPSKSGWISRAEIQEMAKGEPLTTKLIDTKPDEKFEISEELGRLAAVDTLIGNTDVKESHLYWDSQEGLARIDVERLADPSILRHKETMLRYLSFLHAEFFYHPEDFHQALVSFRRGVITTFYRLKVKKEEIFRRLDDLEIEEEEAIKQYKGICDELGVNVATRLITRTKELLSRDPADIFREYLKLSYFQEKYPDLVEDVLSE